MKNPVAKHFYKTNINKIEPQKRDKLLDELSHRESKQTQITYLDQCNLEDLLDVYGNAVYDGVCWDESSPLTGCSCSTINIEQED